VYFHRFRCDAVISPSTAGSRAHMPVSSRAGHNPPSLNLAFSS
jgi:hypothetical protein